MIDNVYYIHILVIPRLEFLLAAIGFFCVPPLPHWVHCMCPRSILMRVTFHD